MKKSRLLDSDYGYCNSNSGFIGLVDRLADLEFRAFQQTVFLWLGARGFRHVHSLGRQFRRGRRTNSGADFVAVPPGLLSSPIAVQVRHWRTPVQRRAVDELRGYMLRNNVSTGMIVTNSSFSNRAQEASTEFPGRPVHLVSLMQLARSMTALKLGITDAYGGLVVDEPFFQMLNHLAFASSHFARKTSAKSKRRLRRLPLDSIHPNVEPRLSRAVQVLKLVALVLLVTLTVIYFVYIAVRP